MFYLFYKSINTLNNKIIKISQFTRITFDLTFKKKKLSAIFFYLNICMSFFEKTIILFFTINYSLAFNELTKRKKERLLSFQIYMIFL